MTLRADEIDVTITPRTSAEGHPFTEILYVYEAAGAVRHALTRRNYHIDDTPHARAHERQEFIKRRRAA